MLSVSAELFRKACRFNLAPCTIRAVVCLPQDDFEYFEDTLLAHHDFLSDYKDLMGQTETEQNCILVLGKHSDDGILCNSEGYSYARYSAPMPGAKAYLDYKMTEIANRVLTEAAKNCKDRMSFVDYDSFRETEGFDLTRSKYVMDLLISKMQKNLGVHSVVPDIKGMRINLEPDLCLEQCRFTAPATQPEQSAKALLKAKIEAEFAEHKTKWLQMSPEELITNCEEIEAITRMYRDAPGSISEEDAEYLLRFRDPLEVLAEEWSARSGIGTLIIDDEISCIVFNMKDRGNDEDYDLDPEFQDDGPQMRM